MTVRIATMEDVRNAQAVIRKQISPAPLIRSYALERELGLSKGRHVWLKDYGWTPVGSFKLMGALFWMDQNEHRIGDRPVIAHSSGNLLPGSRSRGCAMETSLRRDAGHGTQGEVRVNEVVRGANADLRYCA